MSNEAISFIFPGSDDYLWLGVCHPEQSEGHLKGSSTLTAVEFFAPEVSE